jgi:hypothetical protein
MKAMVRSRLLPKGRRSEYGMCACGTARDGDAVEEEQSRALCGATGWKKRVFNFGVGSRSRRLEQSRCGACVVGRLGEGCGGERMRCGRSIYG